MAFFQLNYQTDGERKYRQLIPDDVFVLFIGTSRAWVRICKDGRLACMQERLRGQALPRGSVPLTAFGGADCDGPNFSGREATNFLVVYDLAPIGTCVFEYTRPNNFIKLADLLEENVPLGEDS